MKGEQIAAIEDLLLRVPSHHIRSPRPARATQSSLENPGFKTIRKLIDKGKTWVKLSVYQDSKVGPPSYSDTVPIARAYIEGHPGRAWSGRAIGRTLRRRTSPDDAVLFDLFFAALGHPTRRDSALAVLMQNPATLYGFPTSA